MQLIKFKPVLKTTLWGGDRIIPFKHLPDNMQQVGESWEISGVKGSETVVKDGPLKGKSLNELVRELKGDLVGNENYQRFGDEFPLLVKFIDARQGREKISRAPLKKAGGCFSTPYPVPFCG